MVEKHYTAGIKCVSISIPVDSYLFNLFQTFRSQFVTLHVMTVSENVKKWKRISRSVLFPAFTIHSPEVF